ncbi:MAG: NusA-like transcription termination signal-binding factor [Candidatus Syntropharchaeia archaeon]
MGEVRLGTEEIRYIALFESLTGAVVRDCIIDEVNDKVIFVVKRGDMGLAIGRKGDNINRVRRSIGKNIEVIEYSDDLSEFIENSFQPINVQKVNIVDKNNKCLVYVDIPNKDKGLAIGKNGRNIWKVKLLAQRHHGVTDVFIQ